MSDENGKEGRGGFSRPEEAAPRRRRAWAAGRDSLWGALVPLIVGFALLIGLVFALGLLSADQVSKMSFGTKTDERRLSLMSKTLLDLRLALSRLDAEARIRGRVEAGTGGVMLPPSDLRLRNARGEVEKLLPEFDRLPLPDADKKRAVRAAVDSYLEVTKDL